MKQYVRIAKIIGMFLLIGIFLSLVSQQVYADPHVGQSRNVVFIGGSSLNYTWGGNFPTTGPSGELGDFTFSTMDPSGVNAASLAPFDTVVLSVASSAIQCNCNNL